jgi:uncharacterized membrane protein YdjX (TVP38/TMEM64 family)
LIGPLHGLVSGSGGRRAANSAVIGSAETTIPAEKPPAAASSALDGFGYTKLGGLMADEVQKVNARQLDRVPNPPHETNVALPAKPRMDALDTSPQGQGTRGRRRAATLRAVAALLLVAIPLALVALGVTDRYSLEAIVGARDGLRGYVDAHPVQSALIYWAGYSGAVALSVPGSLVFSVLGGIAFGWVLGAPLALLAGLTGGSIFFLVARAAGAGWVAERAGPRLSRLIGGFRRDAFQYLLSLRLVPLVPFWIVNTGAALAGIPFRVFLLGTVIGAAPSTLALSMAGTGIDSVVAEQGISYRACLAAEADACHTTLSLFDLVTPQLLLGLTALGVMTVLPVVLRRMGWLGFASARQDLASTRRLPGE